MEQPAKVIRRGRVSEWVSEPEPFKQWQRASGMDKNTSHSRKTANNNKSTKENCPMKYKMFGERLLLLLLFCSYFDFLSLSIAHSIAWCSVCDAIRLPKKYWKWALNVIKSWNLLVFFFQWFPLYWIGFVVFSPLIFIGDAFIRRSVCICAYV